MPAPPLKRDVDVVGAVIVRDGLVLCAQRGPGAQAGLWEFPGGKVEPGEKPETALAREIAEELRCTVAVGGRVTTTLCEYEAVTVALTTYWCTLLDGEPVPVEHSEVRWVAPANLPALEWAPADVPAVEIVAETMV